MAFSRGLGKRSGARVLADQVFARCAMPPATRGCDKTSFEHRCGRSVVSRQAKRSSAAVVVTALIAVMAPAARSAAPSHGDQQSAAVNKARFDASVRIDPRRRRGGDVPGHFVGVSIEWTLIDRYMGRTRGRHS